MSGQDQKLLRGESTMPIESQSGGAGDESGRGHRGPYPEDAKLFAPETLPRLRQALADLNWLLSRGYALPSSLALVGDRHALTQRQRLALSRAACADDARARRLHRQVPALRVQNEDVEIDGFNLLITLEAALSGGLLLLCHDGCIRDLSSVHGSYRAVQETERALALAGNALAQLRPRQVRWWLDQPVSNSGRLAHTIRVLAEQRAWPWEVQVSFNPDAELARTPGIVVSSDSAVLDRCSRWVNLGGWLVERLAPRAWVVALGGGSGVQEQGGLDEAPA
jgi:hypothetical protein